jgi:hypothetical protein
MIKIIELQITLQARVSSRSRKNVIRKDDAEGPFRNRRIDIACDIECGPDSGANLKVRRVVSEQLKKHKSGEILFYVVAEFDRGSRIPRYFKTIVPRSQIPAF